MQFDIKRYASFSYFLILLISKFQIMKKTYITPEALQVSLAMSLPLAGSPLNVTTDGDTAGLNDDYADEGTDALVQ